MLFVHPDWDAPSLAEWFGPVDAFLGPHRPEELIEYPEARGSYDIKANWKIVVENYIDIYHLSHLHSNTLHMYDHAKAEYGWKGGPHYHFWEPPPAADYAKKLERNLPTPPRVIAEPHVGAWVPMLFPGLGLGASEDSWNLFSIIPLGPDLTRVQSRTKLANVSSWEFTKQEWRSWSFWKSFGGPKYQGDDVAGEDDPMASGDFTAEDIYACEQQQKALTSLIWRPVRPLSEKARSPITSRRSWTSWLQLKSQRHERRFQTCRVDGGGAASDPWQPFHHLLAPPGRCDLGADTDRGGAVCPDPASDRASHRRVADL